MGVSHHSLYEWRKKFSASNAKGNDEVEEIRRLRKELLVSPRSEISLKKAAAYSTRDAN
ncbi:hypothetical protein HLH89_34645 [Rhizobium laguerreae]|nr:hypothetical protein [Rhizobium laguerreae]